MKWEEMTWTEKNSLVIRTFGTANSDSGGDELLYLWERIQERELTDAYITALADILGIPVGTYIPAQVMELMLASEDSCWLAALRAAGVIE